MPSDPFDDLAPEQREQIVETLADVADLLSDVADRVDAIEERLSEHGDIEERLSAIENEPAPRTLAAHGRRNGRPGR